MAFCVQPLQLAPHVPVFSVCVSVGLEEVRVLFQLGYLTRYNAVALVAPNSKVVYSNSRTFQLKDINFA